LTFSEDPPQSAAITLEDSPLESARFGFRVGRLTAVEGSDFGAVAVALGRLDEFDLVILRYPAHHVSWFAALDAARHLPIHADTLQYWTKEVYDPVVVSAPESDSVSRTAVITRSALQSDSDLIARMTADVFAGYPNHYAANPIIDPAWSLAGYVEWATTSVDRKTEHRRVIVAERSRSPVGFATINIGRDGVEVQLAGVLTNARRTGVYQALLTAVDELTLEVGSTRWKISTQVGNTATLRRWASHGMRPGKSLQTVHLTRRTLLETLAVSTPHSNDRTP